MNINNLLKTCTLACAMIFCLNNNADANMSHHNVNSKIFQHEVSIRNNNTEYRYEVPVKKIYVKNPITHNLEEMHIWYSNEQYKAYANDIDEYNYPEYNCIVTSNNNNQIDDIDVENKFNELYNISKGNNDLYEDTITTFENAVRRVFGNDYKVVTKISDILLQYPENRTHEKKLDNTEKDFVKINTENNIIYNSNQLYQTLEDNDMQLITKYKNYQWNASNILLDIFHNNRLILTNGKNVICYDYFDNEIRVYTKLHYSKMKNPCSDQHINEKFNEVGLVLQEKYRAEKRAVREVFGQDFILSYAEQ